ncbi:hypothetical protein FHS90_000095 [Rufibacter quisquiliarum]|uniref:Uncharacterized protein n=1 Tax=Rufibacter quisquiliarum TaxID=1549639 RepID=A0A839GLQ2_9BACT|nr:hypothetical protein [Rufibacter quisquiliarum]
MTKFFNVLLAYFSWQALHIVTIALTDTKTCEGFAFLAYFSKNRPKTHLVSLPTCTFAAGTNS